MAAQNSRTVSARKMRSAISTSRTSQLDQQSEREAILALAQVRRETRNERSGRSAVASGRRHAALAREVRDVRGAVVELEAERHELVRHVVEREGGVPR